MELSREHATYRVTLLVAIACVLQISESLIPHPVPGLRLGLAGMVTLVALVTLGFRRALEIAILRTLLSSFIIGTFLSPTFILSAAGAVASTIVMGLAFQLSRPRHRFGFSIIGISIAGALTHNTVQVLLAYVLLVRHSGIFALLPMLAVGAAVMGTITGLVAAGVCRRLDAAGERQRQPVNAPAQSDGPVSRLFQPGESVLHRMPPALKIGMVVALAIAALAVSDLRFYLGLAALLAAVVALSRTSPVFILRRVKRFAPLLVMAFLLPALFSSGSDVLYRLGSLRITTTGLTNGALFSVRILYLMAASSLLVHTTSPEELARGLTELLSPLRFLGVSGARTAALLTESWLAVPVYWETARRAIRGIEFRKARTLRNLVPLLSDLIADLYLFTDSPASESERGEGDAVPHGLTARRQPEAMQERGGGRTSLASE